MFCNNCGRNNLDTASFCENCGAPLNNFTQNPYQNHQPAPVPKCIGNGQMVTNLILSFLCAQWICIILDIVSLVFRSNYENALHYGDYKTAQSKASSIKTMMIISWILYAITIAVIITILIVAGTAFSFTVNRYGTELFNSFSAMM